MTIEQGVFKETRIKRQSAKGTLATTTGAQVIRRESSINELTKETYDTSSQITKSQQVRSLRHGIKLVNCALDDLLSPGTHSDVISSIVRRDFSAVTSITGASITIAASGSNFTLTRASGSFLTDGIKVGNVVRLTAGTFVTGNLNNNVLVLNVTALVLTVATLNGFTLTAEGPITGATISVPGKVTYVPESGHTNIYYTVEDFYNTGTGYSERNRDVKYGKVDIAMPGSGNVTVKFAGNGIAQTDATTEYFTTPTAETLNEVFNSASGVLIVNGGKSVVITDMSFSIDGGIQPADGVVGTDERPDIFSGIVKVSGTFTAYFEDGVMPALFKDESVINIISVLTDSKVKNANFNSFAMSSVKLTGATPDDGQTGLKRTYPFTATQNLIGGAALANHSTSIMIQDSLAA